MAGVKHDQGKVRMDLLPNDALLAVAQVLTMGAAKYGDRNWEEGIPASRLEAGLLRHLTQWKMHQDKDSESGLPHLAHMACNALMLLALELRYTPNFDDRPPVYGFNPLFDSFFSRKPIPPKEVECPKAESRSY